VETGRRGGPVQSSLTAVISSAIDAPGLGAEMALGTGPIRSCVWR
jgi:hypothetical protein